ncbi:hypothetical protein KJ359_012497 [Pestalotiopsis sp. 9143b]|nr:hypothetical protein KJ359_012497 [Pestalotiopsis sp. 9143b]
MSALVERAAGKQSLDEEIRAEEEAREPASRIFCRTQIPSFAAFSHARSNAIVLDDSENEDAFSTMGPLGNMDAKTEPADDELGRETPTPLGSRGAEIVIDDDSDGGGGGGGNFPPVAGDEDVKPEPEYITVRLKDSARYQRETTVRIYYGETLRDMMETYARGVGSKPEVLRFITFDGQRIQYEDTIESLELENDDIIDVLEEQQGGA